MVSWLVLWGCARMNPQSPSAYGVDTQTVWHTVVLTADGMHYGVNREGVLRNGPLHTVWLQKRSANRPYLYETWQVNMNCANRQWMWLLRAEVENNQVKAIEHEVVLDWDGRWLKNPSNPAWMNVKADSKEEKVMQAVCEPRQ